MSTEALLVAFQGETGAYSEEATVALFGPVETFPCPSFEAVFASVSGHRADFAVIPIENSLFGSVSINYDLLRRNDLVIVGELKLRVRHNLMALPGVTIADIRRVLSHPQALGQCSSFLQERLSHAEAVPVYDTAGAAKMVSMNGDTDAAAIASGQAARHYGLNVLAEGIESDRQNYTRFLVLSRPGDGRFRDRAGSKVVKTSLVYAMRENVPGSLFKSLAAFALRDINLFKIESRPLVGSPGQYLFYLDVQGDADSPALQRALDHLGEMTAFVRVLGSYPEGRTVE